MKPAVLFALVTAVLVGGATAVFLLVFPDPAAHEALEVTAILAFVVHLVAFAVSRRLRQWNVWGAWFAGSAVRYGTLVVYVVLVVKVLMYPVVPALVGFATFMFLPTLIEPLLLRK